MPEVWSRTGGMPAGVAGIRVQLRDNTVGEQRLVVRACRLLPEP